MADLENELVQLLRDFTAKVVVAVRRSAMESASAVLGSVAARVGDGAGNGAPRAKRSASARRGSPAAQPALDAEALGEQVVSSLRSQPGLRMEQLAVALQLPTDALKPLVKKLVGQGKLRVEGQARGTRYFPGSGRPARAKARRKAKPGRKRGKRS